MFFKRRFQIVSKVEKWRRGRHVPGFQQGETEAGLLTQVCLELHSKTVSQENKPKFPKITKFSVHVSELVDFLGKHE